MVTVLPSYVGMCLPLLRPSTFIDFTKASHSLRVHFFVILSALFDIGGSMGTAVGLFYTGSGIYQVLFSSVIIFTALVSRLFLKRPLSWRQWGSVFIVTFGLALSASSGGEDQQRSNILIGSVFVLSGTVLISSAYVIDQHILDQGMMESRHLCYYTGLYSSILVLVYILTYTVPRFEDLILSQVALAEGNMRQIVWVFLALCGVNVAHNSAYFVIVEEEGSVTTGLLQSLRAVAVFFASALMYCHVHAEQCMTLNKALSAFVVVGGVIAFLVSPSALPIRNKVAVV